MLYRSEILFGEKLVSSLKTLNVTKIPFSNDSFQKGMSSMAEYLESNVKREDYQEIALLFLKRPILGTYDRMIDVLMTLNGRSLSFLLKNPYWEEATIDMNGYDAKEILDQDDNTNINKDIIINAAKAFCAGAEINIG